MFGDCCDLFLDKCRDAFLACAIILVQGNLMAINLEHICFALLTGAMTGIFAVGSSLFGFFTFGKNVWLEAWVTGIFTMMADMISHSLKFGGVFWGEAALTGLVGAMVFMAIKRIKLKFINT
jgi:hypothetical protein